MDGAVLGHAGRQMLRRATDIAEDANDIPLHALCLFRPRGRRGSASGSWCSPARCPPPQPPAPPRDREAAALRGHYRAPV